MPLECLAQKPFGSREVSRLAEPEFNGVAVAVDRPVKIPPLAPDANVDTVRSQQGRVGEARCTIYIADFCLTSRSGYPGLMLWE